MTERICKQCCLHWPAQSYPTFEHLFYGAILAISGNYRSKSYRKTKKHWFDQNLFDLSPWSKAVDESLDGVTGKYYADCQEAKFLNPQAEDEDLAKKLWEKSAELVQL